MLRKYKQFLLGFLIGSLLFSSITVFADITEIKAFLSDIKIALNGQVLELKDVNGNKVQPIVYNGTTYLPVRALANAFEKEVDFNGTTNTVEIKEKTIAVKPAELAPKEKEPFWKSHNANPVAETILKVNEPFKSENFKLTLNEITKTGNVLKFQFIYENNSDKAIQKYRMINAVSEDKEYKSVSTILLNSSTGTPLSFGYPANSKGELFVCIVDHEKYKYIEITNYDTKWQIR